MGRMDFDPDTLDEPDEVYEESQEGEEDLEVV